MCTNITLTSKNKDSFFGRTMDLSMSMFGEDAGIDLNISLVSIPKNISINSQLDAWESKYSVLGVCTKDTSVLYDGINEHGLVGDCQVLMEANYSPISEIKAKGKTPIIALEFVTFILTNCKDVQEVREVYSEFMLTDTPYLYKDTPLQFPLHYTFVDASGEGIVLEPVESGGFKLYDYIGVTTNSPEYDYHRVNIRNYIGLENIGVSERRLNNTILQPIENGTGYGLLGMPGDYTSPSRFIRAYYFKNMVDAFDSEHGINTLYSVFRPLIIPRGLEHAHKEDTITDYTRYWSGYDLTHPSVYIQTGEGLAITSKVLDESVTNITYTDIRLDNHVFRV